MNQRVTQRRLVLLRASHVSRDEEESRTRSQTASAAVQSSPGPRQVRFPIPRQWEDAPSQKQPHQPHPVQPPQREAGSKSDAKASVPHHALCTALSFD